MNENWVLRSHYLIGFSYLCKQVHLVQSYLKKNNKNVDPVKGQPSFSLERFHEQRPESGKPYVFEIIYL